LDWFRFCETHFTTYQWFVADQSLIECDYSMLGRLLIVFSCSMKEGTAPGMAQDGLTMYAWDRIVLPRDINGGHLAVHSRVVMWAILDHFQEA